MADVAGVVDERMVNCGMKAHPKGARDVDPSPMLDDGAACVRLLRAVGLYALTGYDGCSCAHCKVLGFNIDVSCRKSGCPDGYSALVRVTSAYSGMAMEDLRLVGEEVRQQVMEGAEWPVAIRYASYKQDKDGACVYCTKPRENAAGYLCNACLTGRSAWGTPIADDYDYLRI